MRFHTVAPPKIPHTITAPQANTAFHTDAKPKTPSEHGRPLVSRFQYAKPTTTTRFMLNNHDPGPVTMQVNTITIEVTNGMRLR